jgi:hypothetical protein
MVWEMLVNKDVTSIVTKRVPSGKGWGMSFTILRKWFVSFKKAGRVYNRAIYQLQSTFCEAFYMGLTAQTLSGRMNGHRHDVKNQYVSKPIIDHAKHHDKSELNSCFTVKAIRSVSVPFNYSVQRRWEVSHIRVLQSLQTMGQSGLNLR